MAVHNDGMWSPERVSCTWFFAIEQRRKSPDQNDRSYDEIEEILDKAFDRVFGMTDCTKKEPWQNAKEWWRNRNRNEESAKPATAQQSESS